MTCEDCRIACFELLDCALGAEAEREMLAHVEACPDCAKFLEAEKARMRVWPHLLEHAAGRNSAPMSPDAVMHVMDARISPRGVGARAKTLRVWAWLSAHRGRKAAAASLLMLAAPFFALAGIVAAVWLAASSKPEAEGPAPELEENVAEAAPPALDVAADVVADAEPAGAVEGMQACFREEEAFPGQLTEAAGLAEPETIAVAEEPVVSLADPNQEKESKMKFRHVIAAGGAAVVLAAPSAGATLFNGSAGNDWNTPANWTGGAVPGSGDSAVIGSTAPSASANAVVQINPGETGIAADISLGKEATASGRLIVNGGSLALLSSASSVGENGTGELIVTNQATLEGGAITVGSAKGSQGTLRILDGGALRNPSNTVIVAAAGTSTLQVAGGIIDTPSYGITGGSTVGGKATILFDNGASVTAKNFLLAGWGVNSRADLTVRGNSTVVNLGDLTLGSSAGSSGAIAFESGSWIQKGIVYVGNKPGATGSATISGGGFQPQTEVRLGADAGSFGFLTVTNTTLIWTNTSSTVYAGLSGSGTLDVVDSTMSFRTLLYVANYSGATGSVHLVDSDVTNRASLIVGNLAGSVGGIVQSGGSLTVSDYFRLPANGTGVYVATNAVFNGKWVTVAAYGFGTTAIGRVDLSGTQRVFRASSSLAVGTQGAGSITNRVSQYAGGIDLSDASATLTVGGTGNIHIGFDEDPIELGMYWGFRWRGDHVADLTALHDSVPAKLTWNVSRLDPFYQADIGIYRDATYTYVGIPVDRFAPLMRTLILVK